MRNLFQLLIVLFIVSFLAGFNVFHLEHSFSYKFVNSDVHTANCGCGYFEVEEHCWDNGVVTLEPTEEADGEQVFTCILCKTKKTEVVEKITPEQE